MDPKYPTGCNPCGPEYLMDESLVGYDDLSQQFQHAPAPIGDLGTIPVRQHIGQGYPFGEEGDGQNPTVPTILDVAPWQMHRGWTEDHWSGKLTESVVAILNAMPVFQGLQWKRTPRNKSGLFWHWAISIGPEVVFVDFVEYNPGDQQVTLMFNQEQLIITGDSREIPTYRFPIQAVHLMAFAVGLYLSYKHDVVFGRNWFLQPIVKAFDDLACQMNLYAGEYPQRDFDEWMKNFFWIVMGFAPEYMKAPYRIMVYGGNAL